MLEGVATGPVLYAHATRLEELRRTVVALRIEADLQLGRHHEIIGELNSMVAAEPTREDICAKLMIALYRSGRRADALGVYQRIRTALVDELGLDPAAELQRLHQLMLEANPELDLPSAQPSDGGRPHGQPAPAQLPADIPDFVGRQAELDTLTRAAVGRRHRRAGGQRRRPARHRQEHVGGACRAGGARRTSRTASCTWT